MEKQRFIVFEGIDGSGKTTQIRHLKERLSGVGQSFVLTREPTGSPIGKFLREALAGDRSLAGETIALLFAADRCQHILDVVIPKMDSGNWVISDRYYLSNFAYQGSANNMDRLIAYNTLAMNRCVPDIVFFLDVSPEECMNRLSASRSEFEIYENLSQLREIRENYLRVFENLKDRENIVIIDGSHSEETVAKIVWSHLVNLL